MTKETTLSGSLSGITYTVKTSGTTGYHNSQLSLAVDPTTLGPTLEQAAAANMAGTETAW